MKQKGSSRTPCQGSAGSLVDLLCSSYRKPRPLISGAESATGQGMGPPSSDPGLTAAPQKPGLKAGSHPTCCCSCPGSLSMPWAWPISCFVSGCWWMLCCCRPPGGGHCKCWLLSLAMQDRIGPSEPRTTLLPHPTPPSFVDMLFLQQLNHDEGQKLQLHVSAHSSVSALPALWTCLLWMLPPLRSPSAPYSSNSLWPSTAEEQEPSSSQLLCLAIGPAVNPHESPHPS